MKAGAFLYDPATNMMTPMRRVYPSLGDKKAKTDVYVLPYFDHDWVMYAGISCHSVDDGSISWNETDDVSKKRGKMTFEQAKAECLKIGADAFTWDPVGKTAAFVKDPNV